MKRNPYRAYCSGPLFNAKEKEEMGELASCLEQAGFETFLPQRDGLELTRVVEALVGMGLQAEQASDIAAKAVFALDVYQVVARCDGMVVNLNGRVPDEGAVAEAAIAWSWGKAIVGYKADSRSVFLGRDNPLVTGLFGFRICSSCRQAARELKQALSRERSAGAQPAQKSQQVKQCLELGSRIWTAATKSDETTRIGQLAAVLYDEATRGASCAKKGARAFA